MKLHFLFILFIGLYIHAIASPYLQAAEGSTRESFGLLAHWPFDEDYSSSVNNDLYQGRPKGGSLVSIIHSKQIAKVGGARGWTAELSRAKNFRRHSQPALGYRNAEVFSVVAWYRQEDLSETGRIRDILFGNPHRVILGFRLREENANRMQRVSDRFTQLVSDSSGPNEKGDGTTWRSGINPLATANTITMESYGMSLPFPKEKSPKK